MGCGDKSVLYITFNDTQDVFVKLGGDPTYIGVSVDVFNALNKTRRDEILCQAAKHSPNLTRLENTLYA